MTELEAKLKTALKREVQRRVLAEKRCEELLEMCEGYGAMLDSLTQTLEVQPLSEQNIPIFENMKAILQERIRNSQKQPS